MVYGGRFALRMAACLVVALSSVLFAGSAWAAVPGGSLDSTSIPKYEVPLLIPPVMPSAGEVQTQDGRTADYYEIAVRQFDAADPASRDSQDYRLELRRGQCPGNRRPRAGPSTTRPSPSRPMPTGRSGSSGSTTWWMHQGNYLPHLLPVDQTLHWANPPGGDANKDHGRHGPGAVHRARAHRHPRPRRARRPESDGYPEAWWLPGRHNIPAGYASTGLNDSCGQIARSPHWKPGPAVFQYPNDQRAPPSGTTIIASGMTRVNVYAGPAGFYLLRGGPRRSGRRRTRLPGPAPQSRRPVRARSIYEIPIVIQDRSFNADGSLFYPDNRAFFEGLIPAQLRHSLRARRR